MCEAFVKHGSDYTIEQWIAATLEDRMAVATLNGFSMRLDIQGLLAGGRAVTTSMVPGGR